MAILRNHLNWRLSQIRWQSVDWVWLSSASEPNLVQRTKSSAIHWISPNCSVKNSIEQRLCYVVSKNTKKHVLYWSKSSFEKLVYWFSRPVLQKKSIVQKWKVRFTSIVYLFLCEFDLTWLLNSIHGLRSIEFDEARLKYIPLGSINFAGNKMINNFSCSDCDHWLNIEYFTVSTLTQ